MAATDLVVEPLLRVLEREREQEEEQEQEEAPSINRRWLIRYGEFKEFLETNGHTNVPTACPLGKWWFEQCWRNNGEGKATSTKNKCRRMPLSNHKLSLLNDLGVDWTRASYRRGRPIAAKELIAPHTPNEETTTTKKQKTTTEMIETAPPPPPHIQRMSPEAPDGSASIRRDWMAQYQEYCKKQRNNWSTPVGPRLQRWIYTTRFRVKAINRDPPLSDLQRELLNKVGFDRGGQKGVPPLVTTSRTKRNKSSASRIAPDTPNKQKTTPKKHRTTTEMIETARPPHNKRISPKEPSSAKRRHNWMAQYQEYCKLQRNNWSTPVGPRLQRWIYSTRSRAKANTSDSPLSDLQRELLNKVGFDLEGQKRVSPLATTSRTKRKSSASLIAPHTPKKQKTTTKKQKTTTEMIETARSPHNKKVSPKGPRSANNRPNWMAQYQEYCKLQRNNWSTPVGPRMQRWIYSTRFRAKANTSDSPLSDRQRELLNKVGFNWEGQKGVSSLATRSTTKRKSRAPPSRKRVGRLRNKSKSRKNVVTTSSTSLTASHFVPPTEARIALNGGIIKTITIAHPSTDTQPKTNSFLSLWAEGRDMIVSHTISNGKVTIQPQREFTLHGRTFSLVGRKIYNESSSRGFFGAGAFAQKTTRIDLVYIAIEGPGLVEWDLQEKLEKIADFRSLAPCKAVARLQHLLTPGPSAHVWQLNKDLFEFIEEDFHQGCGFIPESLVEELTLTASQATKIQSLQVRCIGPSIGVVKGMLLKTKAGIDKIQIPPSMQKALPSRDIGNDQEQWVYMIAKGVYPTMPNMNIGRYLDPESDNPPKSFLERPCKRLSDMYYDLMYGLGVESRVLDRYRTKAMTMPGLKHTHLRGVRDPTGLLPENMVYITGNIPAGVKKVFVTRSPCREPSDAKLFKLVSSKPSGMPQASWRHLCDFGFGHIIFPVPQTSNIPLPTIVGEGDLDGDDYFVCWDHDILQELVQPKVMRPWKEDERVQREKCRYDNEAQGPTYREGSSRWLEEAQDVMLDLTVVVMADEITGKLYNLSVKTSKQSEDGIYDCDARAFARAYKDSLDTLKHGGVVELPRHLKDKIKSTSLQECFRWV